MATDVPYSFTAQQAVSSNTAAATATAVEVDNWDEEIRNTFQQLRRSVLGGEAAKTIALTSCFPCEGVTAMSRGLVKAAMEAGQATLLLSRPEHADAATTAADLRAMIRDARDRRMSVVIDAGALSRDGWVLELNGLVDGVVLVIESGRCRPDDVADAVAMLQRVALPVVGSVVNRARRAKTAVPGD